MLVKGSTKKLIESYTRFFGHLAEPPVLITTNQEMASKFKNIIASNWKVSADYHFDQNHVNQHPPEVYTADQYKETRRRLWSYDSERPKFNVIKYMEQLQTVSLGRSIIYAPVLASTQQILFNRFRGVNEGLACTAGVQTSALARGQNKWEGLYGCLMFSYKSTLPSAKYLPQMQYLVSLAIIKTIQSYPECKELDVGIKWPNDIYANKKMKICGIMCQSSLYNNEFDITSGIGMNISNQKPTTCLVDMLREKYGNNAPEIFKEDFLAKYFNIFEPMYRIFREEGFSPFISQYLDNWLHKEQKVKILANEKKIEVIVRGINIFLQKGLSPEGFLLAEDKSGVFHELLPDGNRFDFFNGLISKKTY